MASTSCSALVGRLKRALDRRLVDGDIHARRLGAIELLEIDELACGIDDGDRHVPAVLLSLGYGGARDLSSALEIDRCP